MTTAPAHPQLLWNSPSLSTGLIVPLLKLTTAAADHEYVDDWEVFKVGTSQGRRERAPASTKRLAHRMEKLSAALDRQEQGHQGIGGLAMSIWGHG